MSGAEEVRRKVDAARIAASPADPSVREPVRKSSRTPRPKATRPAGPRKRTPITVGGVQVSFEDAVAALEVLRSAPGIMVRQPLVKARNPLSECDYHQFANETRATIPELAKLNTKPAFIAGLERLTGR